MNLDERIKQELGDEAEHLDQLLTNDKSIFAMLASAYRGSLGRWLLLVFIVGTLGAVVYKTAQQKIHEGAKTSVARGSTSI